MAWARQRRCFAFFVEFDGVLREGTTLLPSVVLFLCDTSSLVVETSLFVIRSSVLCHSLVLRHSLVRQPSPRLGHSPSHRENALHQSELMWPCCFAGFGHPVSLCDLSGLFGLLDRGDASSLLVEASYVVRKSRQSLSRFESPSLFETRLEF